MTPSNACTTVMAIPRNAIAMRERMPIAIRTVSNKATLREAAYQAKLSSLPGPSRPATEKPALTTALRSVMRAQLQNRFVIGSPFVALVSSKSTAFGLAARDCPSSASADHDSPLCTLVRSVCHIYFAGDGSLSDYGRVADD